MTLMTSYFPYITNISGRQQDIEMRSCAVTLTDFMFSNYLSLPQNRFLVVLVIPQVVSWKVINQSINQSVFIRCIRTHTNRCSRKV